MAQTGVNVKMGVSGVNEFKRNLRDAEESVKSLDAALELNEKQFKATGDAEAYMEDKADLLERKLERQRDIVDKVKSALDTMKEQGIDQASTAYQKMQQTLLNAQGDLLDTENELKKVGEGGTRAGDGVDDMNGKLKQIGKGVAFDNVTKGIRDITNTLEAGARAAMRLGKRILDSAKGSTEWADELLTLSKQTGIDTTRLQQMRNVSELVDTDVDAILNAQARMQKATQTKGGVKSIEEVLGISLKGQNAEDLFWEIGEALTNMGEGFDKEAAAQQVFGRSWRELLPLFLTGREEYEKMLGEQRVLSEDQVEKLGEADDAIKSFELQIQQLKNEFWAENADKITELLQWFVDHKDAVVGALEGIAAGFGLLKLGESAANVMKLVDGFKTLTNLKQPGTGGTSGAEGLATGGGIFRKMLGNAGLTAGGGGIYGLLGGAGIAAYVGIAATMVAANLNAIEQMNQMEEKGKASLEKTDKIRTDFQDSPYMGMWEQLNNYLTVGGDNNSRKQDIEAFAKHYMEWFNDETQDALLDHLTNDLMTNEEYDAFHEAMEKVTNGSTFYTDAEKEAFESPLLRMLEIVESEMEQSTKTEEAGKDIADAAAEMKKLPQQTASAVSSALKGISINIDGMALTGAVGRTMGGLILEMNV